jgi:anti-sigma B factor antagonist
MTATPASHPFEIREHDEAGVHVVAMRGELDLATAPRLAVRIDNARRAGMRRILLDMTTTDFCDSTGLRALVGCRQEIVASGGRFAVAVLGESAVGRMFTLAGAAEMLPVYEGFEPALAALAPAAS